MDLRRADIDELPYPIYRLSSLLQRTADEQLKANLLIGTAQFRVLIAVSERAGCEQKQLAKKLGLTEASISRQVSLMRKADWLDVQKDRKDARRRNLYLTPKGKHTLIQAERLLAGYYKNIFKRLSSHDLQSLNKSIRSITSLL